MVGGVASGKTTQLYVARERLKAVGDVCAIYMDVSLLIEPNEVKVGQFVFLAGRALSRELSGDQRTDEVDAALAVLRKFHSYSNRELVDSTGIVAEALRQRCPHIVPLIDSLDRMSNLARFAGIVEDGISALRSLGIGIIIIGPLTALYGLQRTTLDRFDRTWHLPTVDVQNDADGREFLLAVLRARDTDGLLADEAAVRLAALSGGVLRDLIGLTQAAAEEAYVDGAEHIRAEHVDLAADQLGRKHLVAVDSEQLAVLQRVRTQGTFVQTSEKDLALLATRRVLEYANGKPRFAVHPTLEPLLAQIAGTP